MRAVGASVFGRRRPEGPERSRWPQAAHPKRGHFGNSEVAAKSWGLRDV